MKTVLELTVGKISRKDDSVAKKLVSEGTHKYVPKSEWKKLEGYVKTNQPTNPNKKKKKKKVRKNRYVN